MHSGGAATAALIRAPIRGSVSAPGSRGWHPQTQRGAVERAHTPHPFTTTTQPWPPHLCPLSLQQDSQEVDQGHFQEFSLGTGDSPFYSLSILLNWVMLNSASKIGHKIDCLLFYMGTDLQNRGMSLEIRVVWSHFPQWTRTHIQYDQLQSTMYSSINMPESRVEQTCCWLKHTAQTCTKNE